MESSSVKNLRDIIAKFPQTERNIFLLKYYNSEVHRHLKELEFIREKSGSRVLEIGASPYHFTGLCSLEGIEITSVDIEPDYEDLIVKTLGLNLVKCNIETERLPFDSDSFDVILLNEVFEHLRINPIATLGEINRVLKPNGYLYLTTPNFYCIRNIYGLVFGRGFDDPFDQFNKLNTVGYMGHVREYTRSQVIKFLVNTGFSIENVTFHNYDQRAYLKPFYYLIPNVRTNICVVSQKL